MIYNEYILWEFPHQISSSTATTELIDMKIVLKTVAMVTIIAAAMGAYAAEASDLKPFVVPELKSWSAGEGTFVPGEELRVAVPSGDTELLRVAGMLAADWKTLLGYSPEVISGKGGRGDIILEVKKDRSLDKASGGSDEAYSLGTGLCPGDGQRTGRITVYVAS